MLEKYIVCDACGLRSPHLSLVACYILYLLIALPCRNWSCKGCNKHYKSFCFRCKNTWHVESNHILQPPKYLIIVVNRFRYINNFTKDKCSIPMDMTAVLSLHKLSLHATKGHHGPSMYSGPHTASINCCKTYDSKITEFEMIDTKNSSAAYVVMYNLIT